MLYDCIGRHKIEASRGVDQGCPLGALLFAITIRDTIEKILERARALDPNSSLHFYLDDGYLTVKPEHAEEAIQFLEQEFLKLGLKLNMSKLQVWCQDRSLVPSTMAQHYTEDFRVLKRFLVTPGDTDHQGLPLQTSPQTLDKEINRAQQLTAGLLRLVKAGLDLHTAGAMFRTYSGPASQYTLRSSELTHDSALEYDVAIAACWSDISGRPVSPEEPRLWLPVRSGGLGVESARARVNAAPWAAWTSVIDEVARHMGNVDAEDFLDKTPLIAQRVVALHARLVGQGAPACISYVAPARALAIGATQKFLTAHIHKGALQTLRTSIGDDRAAFHRTTCGPAAGAFLEVPLDDRWAMTNARFATAVRRRLGLPHPGCAEPPGAVICPNVAANGHACGTLCDDYGMHLETCAPGGGLMVRHDNLVRCLGVLAARNLDPRPKLEQIVPELAQPVRGQVGQARLDVIVHDGLERLLIDVVIVSAYAGGASFRASCARRDGFASRRAAVAKRARYPSPELVPFAVETGGRLGNDARAFLIRMADAAEDRNAELKYLQRAISSVIQDGVARQLAGS